MKEKTHDQSGRLLFTKRMKKEYTVLIPMMAPIHFELITNVFRQYGYRTVLLTNNGPGIVARGLKYVHNDTCYPALLVIGQMIDALDSGQYDLERTALIITQTGGGCRASNYIHLLRKALIKAGYEKIPVISLNLSGLEKNPGFKFTLPMVRRTFAALVYGDALMLLHNQVQPYEVTTGEAERLTGQWVSRLTGQFAMGAGLSLKDVRDNLRDIAKSYAAIPILKTDKIKVGVVGEIYVKYAALGNNDLERFLFDQGCEVSVPGLMGFILFKTDNRLEDIRLYGGSKLKYRFIKLLYDYFEKMESAVIEAVSAYPQFTPPSPYRHTKELVRDIIGYGNKMGEGWLLTAEMVELVEQGYENIVCTQPFGCLPNHIVGKGMIRKIKSSTGGAANIVPIDYDPGATRVNQENRIKLMLSVARENLQGKQELAAAASADQPHDATLV